MEYIVCGRNLHVHKYILRYQQRLQVLGTVSTDDWRHHCEIHCTGAQKPQIDCQTHDDRRKGLVHSSSTRSESDENSHGWTAIEENVAWKQPNEASAVNFRRYPKPQE
jgi:hypothetical protein